MSRRNDAVNKIAQRSALYNSLNAYQRKTFVTLLKVAYEAGRKESTEVAS